MANVTINGLTAASSVDAGDEFEIQQSVNGSRKATIEQVRAKVLTPRGALVKLSANIVNPTLPYIVAWGAEEYDTDAIHDNATNNDRLTVPAGVAWIKLGAIIRMEGSSTNSTIAVHMLKNGAFAGLGLPYMQAESDFADPGTTIVSAPLSVVAGDYFTVYVTNTDSTITLDAGKCCFWMEILA